MPSALILAILPLAWWPARCKPYMAFVEPKVWVILIALTMAAFCWERVTAPARPLRIAICVWILWLAVAFQFSVDPMDSFLGRQNDYSTGFLSVCAYALLFLCASKVPDEQQDELISMAIKAAAVCSFIGILQYIGSYTGHISKSLGGRGVGLIGGPPAFGAYLAMIAPLAYRKRALGALSVIILGVGASGSRGAFLALFAGVLATMALSREWEIPKSWKLAVIALLMALPGFLVRPLMMSDAGRLEAWGHAWQQGLNRSWFGYGVFAAVAPSQGPMFLHHHAHNDFLEAFATAGAPGAVIYIAIWAMLAYYAMRARRPELAGALVALFLSLKINPPCIVGCAVGAVLAGLMVSRSEDEWGL